MRSLNGTGWLMHLATKYPPNRQQMPGINVMLDVLEQLPLHVVDDNVWKQLSHSERCNLRICRRQSLKLTDAIVTSSTLVAPDNIGGKEESYEASIRFLSRLPRLTWLRIVDWGNSQELVNALVNSGACTQGRVTRLTLNSASNGFCEATLSAVALSVMSLQELHLAQELEVYPEDVHLLEGLVFQSLESLGALTKVRL